MAGYGYSYVSDKGFIAFTHELENGAWKGVSIKKLDQDDSMARAPLAEAPLSVVWKVRAVWGIRSLSTATSTDVLTTLDAEWDSAQRAFNLGVGAAEEHQNKEVREAAGRVRASLLGGEGTAQTRLSFDQQVDFGIQQAELAAKKPLADDLKRIDAGAHLVRIHGATAALAKGLGRDTGKGRSPSRARRVREALAVCSTAFNGIHDEIAWAIEHTSDKEDRAQLEALLLPFQQLLDRYPPSAGAGTAEGDGTPPPAPVTEPDPA